MMNTYVFSYDLNSPGQKYTELHELIESITVTWCRPVSSFYLVKTSLSIHEFQNKVRTILDDNDTFIVIRCSNEYGGWLDQDQWPFIKDHIFG